MRQTNVCINRGRMLHTRLLEGSEHRMPSVKEEKENRFITRDFKSLFIEGTNNVV